MNIAITAVLVLHLACMAFVVVTWLINLRSPRIAKGVWHACAGSLATGFILIALVMGSGDHLNLPKIMLKMCIAIVLLGTALLGSKVSRDDAAMPVFFHVLGVGTLLNGAIALLWT